MAVYWCITAALLSDLYRKYCDSEELLCNERRPKRFLILPILANLCMIGWVSVLYHMKNYRRHFGHIYVCVHVYHMSMCSMLYKLLFLLQIIVGLISLIRVIIKK